MTTAASNPTALSGTRTSPAGALTGRFEVSGHQLYWELHGAPDRPVVMFLHHGLGSVRAWRRQIPACEDGGWRVLAFDRWGYGRSDPRPRFDPGFLLQDADETLGLMDALGLGRIAIVGHSDGGTIGLLLAASHPERVERLVVAAAHIYREQATLDGLFTILASAQEPPLKASLQREHGDRWLSLVQAWVGHWTQPEMEGLSLLGELPKVVCPTLVIQGELDEHATHQHARDIAAGVRQGTLWLIPGVHHMPPNEIPHEFNRRLLSFLEPALLAPGMPAVG